MASIPTTNTKIYPTLHYTIQSLYLTPQDTLRLGIALAKKADTVFGTKAENIPKLCQNQLAINMFGTREIQALECDKNGGLSYLFLKMYINNKASWDALNLANKRLIYRTWQNNSPSYRIDLDAYALLAKNFGPIIALMIPIVLAVSYFTNSNSATAGAILGSVGVLFALYCRLQHATHKKQDIYKHTLLIPKLANNQCKRNERLLATLIKDHNGFEDVLTDTRQELQPAIPVAAAAQGQAGDGIEEAKTGEDDAAYSADNYIKLLKTDEPLLDNKVRQIEYFNNLASSISHDNSAYGIQIKAAFSLGKFFGHDFEKHCKAYAEGKFNMSLTKIMWGMALFLPAMVISGGLLACSLTSTDTPNMIGLFFTGFASLITTLTFGSSIHTTLDTLRTDTALFNMINILYENSSQNTDISRTRDALTEIQAVPNNRVKQTIAVASKHGHFFPCCKRPARNRTVPEIINGAAAPLLVNGEPNELA